ncbi:MAG: hypothetical protein QM619_02260 [Micropruina sp.]|uniref:hypothetical protein n=1 Tax=Micropruina sp. TaxID=2737536 RepID=UPI0039E4381A
MVRPANGFAVRVAVGVGDGVGARLSAGVGVGVGAAITGATEVTEGDELTLDAGSGPLQPTMEKPIRIAKARRAIQVTVPFSRDLGLAQPLPSAG